jgi:hypothetical protein
MSPTLALALCPHARAFDSLARIRIIFIFIVFPVGAFRRCVVVVIVVVVVLLYIYTPLGHHRRRHRHATVRGEHCARHPREREASSQQRRRDTHARAPHGRSRR